MEKIKILVNQFRSMQLGNGSIIPSNIEDANKILRTILPLLEIELQKTKQEYFYKAFYKDVCEWLDIGLSSIPDFSLTRDSFRMPENGQKTLFIGIVKSQNSLPPHGYYLDFFLCQRVEPKECEDLYTAYPHPKNICQSMKLLDGSSGIVEGNCIVFFPENIISKSKINMQKYALFFFNKFHTIYTFQTLPITEKTISNIDDLKKNGLWSDFQSYSIDQIYNSRCIWGYLHDFYHHSGNKPFDENISLKMNWFVGLLEEIKVDLQTYLTCRKDNKIPYRELVSQYILFDRMFRYPFQKDYLSNFDSGTGIFLFNYLYENDIFIMNSKGLTIDVNRIDFVIENLIKQIQEIEMLDTNELIIESSRLFVNKFLEVSIDRKITAINHYQNVFDINSYNMLIEA